MPARKSILRLPRVSDFANEKDTQGRILCRQCLEPITPGRRNYCSKECMNRFNNDHHWYRIRKFILARDKYTCSICRVRTYKRNLDVDHIIPVRMGIDPFDKNNLRLLCKECHKRKTALEGDLSLSDTHEKINAIEEKNTDG